MQPISQALYMLSKYLFISGQTVKLSSTGSKTRKEQMRWCYWDPQPIRTRLLEILPHPRQTCQTTYKSSQIKLFTLWKYGLPWLTSDDKWTTWKFSSNIELQITAVTATNFKPSAGKVTSHIDNLIDISQYSTLSRLFELLY